MTVATYGLHSPANLQSTADSQLEEISLQGYAVIPSIFDRTELHIIRNKITSIYKQQELKAGKELLKDIGDEHICRCPMAYDSDFINYATNSNFISIAEHFLGKYMILSVQNANISKPESLHAQSSWHRDLPHQNFITSEPLAINFLVAIDEFTHDNGGVAVIPFSHTMEILPSKAYIAKHAVTITANAGDVIVFNSMLIHKAGVNQSTEDRLSFNHMYTRPFIKQQYDYAAIISKMQNINERAYQLSGATSRTAADDMDWRQIRNEKMKR